MLLGQPAHKKTKVFYESQFLFTVAAHLQMYLLSFYGF